MCKKNVPDRGNKSKSTCSGLWRSLGGRAQRCRQSGSAGLKGQAGGVMEPALGKGAGEAVQEPELTQDIL